MMDFLAPVPRARIPLNESVKQIIFDLPGRLLTVEFPPSLKDLKADLVAVGHSQGVDLYSRAEEESITGIDELSPAEAFRKRWFLQPFWSVTVGQSVSHIAWCSSCRYDPVSLLDIDHPRFKLALAVACQDFSARVITWDNGIDDEMNQSSQNKNHLQPLVTLGGTSGHRSFINALDMTSHLFQVDAEDHLMEDDVVATVGDDSTLILWRLKRVNRYEVISEAMEYPLTSPGVAVQFHKRDFRKLLVGEREGTVRILDWVSSIEGQEGDGAVRGICSLWKLNLYAGIGENLEGNLLRGGSLLSWAEWCFKDNPEERGDRIVAVTRGGRWLMWDLEQIEGGGVTHAMVNDQIPTSSHIVRLRPRPSNVNNFAAVSRSLSMTGVNPAITIISGDNLTHLNLHQLSPAGISISSLSWHRTEPIIALTSAGKLVILRAIEGNDGEGVGLEDAVEERDLPLEIGELEYDKGEDIMEGDAISADAAEEELDSAARPYHLWVKGRDISEAENEWRHDEENGVRERYERNGFEYKGLPGGYGDLIEPDGSEVMSIDSS